MLFVCNQIYFAKKKENKVNFLVDIRVIRAIQHKLFILPYETILPLYVQ